MTTCCQHPLAEHVVREAVAYQAGPVRVIIGALALCVACADEYGAALRAVRWWRPWSLLAFARRYSGLPYRHRYA